MENDQKPGIDERAAEAKVSEVQSSGLPPALTRIAVAAAGPILEARGLDPVSAQLVVATASEVAGVAIGQVQEWCERGLGALVDVLARRPERAEAVRRVLGLPRGRLLSSEFFRRVPDAASDARLRDLAAVLVNGLTDEETSADFARSMLRLCTELSDSDAVVLKWQALGYWSKAREADWELQKTNPALFAMGGSKQEAEERTFMRSHAIARLEQLGLLRQTSPRDKLSKQGPFYGPTDLARRFFKLVDDPDLPSDRLVRRGVAELPS